MHELAPSGSISSLQSCNGCANVGTRGDITTPSLRGQVNMCYIFTGGETALDTAARLQEHSPVIVP